MKCLHLDIIMSQTCLIANDTPTLLLLIQLLIPLEASSIMSFPSPEGHIGQYIKVFSRPMTIYI